MSEQTPARPSTAGETHPEIFSFDAWMENFLRVVLRAALVLGILLVGFSIFTVSSTAVFVLYVLLLLVMLVLNFIRFPYRIKAGIFVAVFYVLGMIGILENGIQGDTYLFFSLFMIVASLFFGFRAALYAAGLTLLTGTAMGGLVLTNLLPLANEEMPVGTVITWSIGFLTIVISTMVVPYGLRMLFQEFEKAQTRARETVSLLSQEHDLLETRVTERTEELMVTNKRFQTQTEQMKAVSEVARQIALVRKIDELLPSIAHLISEKLGFYHTGIFLLDQNKEYIVLRATNSEGGKQMLERSHRLKVGGSGIVSYAVTMNRPRIALDVGDDAYFFNNPDLPSTRSEMALPLKIGNQAIGALDVQSTQPGAFSADDLEVMETLADQVAMAFENSRLLEESRQTLAEFQAFSREFISSQWSASSLEQGLIGFQYDPQGVQALIETSRRAEVQNTLATGQITSAQKGVASIAVPLKIRDQVLGVFNVRAKTPGKKFSEEEISFLQATAERVAVSMENARLFREAQKRAAKERSIGRIAAQIGESSNIDQILKTAAEEIGRTLAGSEVIVQIRPQ